MVKKFAKNDEGVSAVIGVILMVAITVILAAVIAAFVFSMSNNVGKTYTVALTVKKATDGSIVVSNNGGADAAKLQAVTLTYRPNVASPTPGSVDATAAAALINVGGSYTITSGALTTAGATTGSTTHVIVTGTFADGAKQVLAEADV